MHSPEDLVIALMQEGLARAFPIFTLGIQAGAFYDSSLNGNRGFYLRLKIGFCTVGI